MLKDTNWKCFAEQPSFLSNSARHCSSRLGRRKFLRLFHSWKVLVFGKELCPAESRAPKRTKCTYLQLMAERRLIAMVDEMLQRVWLGKGPVPGCSLSDPWIISRVRCGRRRL